MKRLFHICVCTILCVVACSCAPQRYDVAGDDFDVRGKAAMRVDEMMRNADKENYSVNRPTVSTWFVCWQLSAHFKYNGDFTEIERVVCDFGETLNRRSEMPIICFSDRELTIYTLRAQDEEWNKESLKYAYSCNDGEVSLFIINGKSLMQAKIVATDDDYIIIDVYGGDRYIFKAMDCDSVHCKCVERKFARLTERIGDFRRSKFATHIIGTWHLDTCARCDSENGDVLGVVCATDEMYYDGISRDYYTFNADGTGAIHSFGCSILSEEDFHIDFVWNYDIASSVLYLRMDKTTIEYQILGVDDNLLFFQDGQNKNIYVKVEEIIDPHR